MLDLPYTNAKVIYRVFRDENRVISATQRYRKGNSKVFPDDMHMLKNAYLMRLHAVRKLFEAMENGSMTDSQRSKIYDHNFDEFLTKPIMAEFQRVGLRFLGDHLKAKNGAQLPLPIPANYDSSAVEASTDT